MIRGKRARTILGTVAVALLPWGLPGRANETDQYTVPTGREFADLRFWLSEHVYDKIEKAVEKTNERIRRSLRDGRPTDQTSQLQSGRTIAAAVKNEFPSFLALTGTLEKELESPETKSRFPGLVRVHNPRTWIYHHVALVVDPVRFGRLLRCATIMANGIYFGTDKILHFCHMGHIYYIAYTNALEKGCSEEQAVRCAVEVGSGEHPISERYILGFIATGVVSNGDIAADYAGLKFYRNLTESVRIKGEMLPPILVRDGDSYRFNDHIRRETDFFTVFISDHWNEALNPSVYAGCTEPFVRAKIQERCRDFVKWNRDEQGRPLTREDFRRVAQELTTYYGEDYGHQGNLDEMITVATVCFETPAAEQVSSPSAGAQPSTRQARLTGHIALSSASAERNRDQFGRTALWRAARAGRDEEVAALLAQSEDVHAMDVDGETPLHAAVRSGHAAIVRTLLQAGARVDAGNVHGLTALHLAAQSGQEEAVGLLRDAGAAVNAPDHYGCTPLHDAAGRSNLSVTAKLLRAGANPNAADCFGTTPLHRAIRAESPKTIEILRAAGADPSIVNSFGESPADEAVTGNMMRKGP